MCFPNLEARERIAGKERFSAGRALRVIHVGPNLYRAGAEQWFIELSKFFDPRRVQLVRAVVTRPTHVDPDYVADLRLPIELGEADSVRRAAKECDVLLSWGVALNEWLADCRPPLCVVVAHTEAGWSRGDLASCDQVLDHVVAVSARVKEVVCNGYPTTVIHNGIDAARVAASRPRRLVRDALGFARDDFVLGFMGRFAPEKRVSVLLEAVARLPPRFKAFLVGWGPYHQALLDQANALIPGRYVFATARDYLGDYYHAMDAVCLISETEGFSMTLLEAMMCSRPLILTPVGSVPEMIKDRITGLVVAGDAASVSQAAELLAQHPEWARAMAAEAKAFAEHQGHARRMARDYEELLHQLWCAKRSSNGGRLAPT
jgi:glycosyltransferase involved in cell wall biosynthesis